MDFGSLCPWNESTLLASLIRKVSISQPLVTRAAGKRNQFQASLFKAPQVMVFMVQAVAQAPMPAVISRTLGPGWVFPILA